MTGGPTRFRRIDPFKTQLAQIKLIDKDIDYSNRVGISHIIIQAFRQHRHLGSALALNKSLHRLLC